MLWQGFILFLSLILRIVDANNDSGIDSSQNCVSFTESVPPPSASIENNRQSIPNGFQTIVFDDESRYEGHIMQGKYHGHGVYTTKEGIYDGEWANGMKHGAGKYSWTDGRIYKGEFRNDKIQGMGMLRTKYGDTYIGMWQDNLQHGKGKYIWKNGSVYKGDFANGNQHGIGRLTKINGEIQEGVWVEGVFSPEKSSTLESK